MSSPRGRGISHDGLRIVSKKKIPVSWHSFYRLIHSVHADILDLREELHILPCPYSCFSCLDSNITTGLISAATFDPEPIYITVFRKKEGVG